MKVLAVVAGIGVGTVGVALRSWIAGWARDPVTVPPTRPAPVASGARRSHRSRRRCRAADAEIPLLLEAVARALRGGASVRQALSDVAAGGDGSGVGALGVELRVIADELSAGRPLVDVLDDWSMASPSPAVRLAASALHLAVTVGGPSARTIDRVAATVREQVQLDREIDGLAASARASAAVLAMAPIGFTLFTGVVDRQTAVFLFDTTPGRLCLLGAALLDIMGWSWMARIVGNVAGPAVVATTASLDWESDPS